MGLATTNSQSNRLNRWLPRVMARGVVACLISATAMVALADAAHADATPGGKLFVGGLFNLAGGDTANNIAAWDGAATDNWSALVGPNGEGTDSNVFAMTLYQGKLVAGGVFLNAGGEVVSGVATWDGTDWEPLISSNGAIGLAILPLGFVADLEVFNGDLYAAGAFSRAGGQDVNNIARWNGTDWLPLTGPSGTGVLQGGSVFGAAVNDMALVDGQLIVGGDFDTAGGVAANGIAAWSGTTWSSLGHPAFDSLTVTSVVNYNGRITIGRGYSVDNFGVTEVAWRDGGVWSALGDPFSNGDIRDMIVYNGLLAAGGSFLAIGGTTVNNVATWNGSTWSALSGPSGVGTNNLVMALVEHWGFLWAGGFFTTAGGQEVGWIARWNGSAWSSVPGGGVGFENSPFLPIVYDLYST
jgi:hypothetical protein